MSTADSTRDEHEEEVMTGVEVKTTKLLWENNSGNNKAGSSKNSASSNNHGTAGANGGEKVENIIEKEVERTIL